jgi:hypothetical protein
MDSASGVLWHMWVSTSRSGAVVHTRTERSLEAVARKSRLKATDADTMACAARLGAAWTSRGGASRGGGSGGGGPFSWESGWRGV